MRRSLALVAALTAGLTMTACSARSAPSSHQASASGVAAPTAAPASSSPAAGLAMTAQQVLAALKAHGAPVTLTVVYTAASDPNHLLGRPGEYTSKADFADSRVAGQETGVTAGGSVEVFTGQADAVRRGLGDCLDVGGAPD